MSKHTFYERIEAFQMTVAHQDSRDEWPEWLEEAASKDCWDAGAIYRTEEGGWELTLESGVTDFVSEDDWIVRAADSSLGVVQDTDFAKRFVRGKEEITVEIE